MAKEFLVQEGQSPEDLARENETLREDAEDYNNRIEDLKSQVERLTSERDQALASSVSEGLEQRVRDLEALIASMRVNGARHHFVYGYQKDLNAHVPGSPQNWVDHCRDCDKEKGHPAHFAQGAQYLDSREVEKAALAAQERLCNILVDGMKLNHRTALNTARELLRGLPGIGEFQPVPGRPEVRE